MATFNAGAIEGRLTLDRSAFTRELRAARAQADAFERDAINVRLETDSTALEALRARIESIGDRSVEVYVRADTSDISFLEQRLNSIGDRTVYVRVSVQSIASELARLQAALERYDHFLLNIDTKIHYAAELARLQAILERYDHFVINIDLNLRSAYGSLGALQAFLNRLDGQTITVKISVRGLARLEKAYFLLAALTTMPDIDIDVDVDTAAATAKVRLLKEQLDSLDTVVRAGVLGGGGGGGGGGGRTSLLVRILQVILALSPLVTSALAVVAAGVVALSGALVGAAGGVAVLAAGFVGLVKRYKDLTEAQKNAAGPIGDFTDAIKDLKDAYDDFLDKIEEPAFETMAQAIDLLASVMPDLTPLFLAFNEVLQGALDGVQRFINSSEYDEMLEFFSTTGVAALEGFLQIGGNLLRFFGNLFDAFGPLTEEFVGGLANMTAGMADWAASLEDNPQFQNFINFVRENGPLILDLLGSIGSAFITLGEGLAPLAAPLTQVLTALFDFIANVPPDVITAIAVGLAAVAVSVWAVNAAMAVFAFVTSPIGAVILAIGAFISIMILAYRESETFRRIIDDSWSAIQDAIGAVKDFIVDEVWPAIKEAWDGIQRTIQDNKEEVDRLMADLEGTFRQLLATISAIWKGITTAFDVGVAIIRTLWRTFGEDLVRFATQALTGVMGVIRGALQVIQGIVQVWTGIFSGDWDKFWDGISSIVEGVIRAITGILQVGVALFGSVVNVGLSAIKGVFNAAMGAIKSLVDEKTRAMVEIFQERIDDIIDDARAMPGKIVKALGNLGSLLVSAGRDLVAGFGKGIRDATAGAVDAAVDAARAAVKAVTGFLGINSPSRVFMEIGAYTGEGMAIGLENQKRSVSQAAQDLIDIAAMRMGGAGTIQNRLGIDAGVPSVSPRVSVSTQAPDLSALVTENRAMREAMERMVDEYGRMVDQQLVLARQGAIR